MAGVEVVLTSSFEGGVGSAHLVWLAAVAGRGEEVHGLRTFDWFENEDLGEGWRGDIVGGDSGGSGSDRRLSVWGAQRWLRGVCNY